MPDLTEMAKEMFHLIHLNWDFQKKETKDNFKTLAKYTQKMVLEAEIKGLTQCHGPSAVESAFCPICIRIKDLLSQLTAIDGEE